MMGGVLACGAGLMTLLYPVAVYFGIQYFEPWNIATVLLVLISLRLITVHTDNKWNQIVLIAACVFCALAIWNNNVVTLRFYPVVISFGMFIVFVSSLLFPPPIIERIARIQHPDLPNQGIIYTRNVTKIWTVFFLFNGIMAASSAIWGSFEWWSLYNGLISYLLMGLIMGIEYMIRLRTQPHVH